MTELVHATASVCREVSPLLASPDAQVSAVSVAPNRNRLLAALSPAEASRLLSQPTLVELRHAEVLYQVGEPIGYVSFPLTALILLMIELEDGEQLEMTAVGREGLVGLRVALGSATDGHMAMVQIPGTALRMEAGPFRAALAGLPELQLVLGRYALALLTQTGQAAACNAHHALNERCARWLLEARDRVGADQFLLTQDFLTAMLGVRRPSVPVAAGMLQQAGLITYHRGDVTIRDREQLEAAACECYRTILEETDRLLGPRTTDASV